MKKGSLVRLPYSISVDYKVVNNAIIALTLLLFLQTLLELILIFWR